MVEDQTPCMADRPGRLVCDYPYVWSRMWDCTCDVFLAGTVATKEMATLLALLGIVADG